MDLDDVDDGAQHGADEDARDGAADRQDDVGFRRGRTPADRAGGFAGVDLCVWGSGEETVGAGGG